MTASPKQQTAAPSAPARAMDGLRRLVRALRSSNIESERRTGITTAQLFVLKHIAEHPGGSLGDVAARTLTTQSTASEVVARLVTRGLVSRKPAADDRRRVVLSATADGRHVLSASSPTVQERLIDAISQLPGNQQEAIAVGLTAWLDAAGFGELAASMFFEPETGAGRLGISDTNSHITEVSMTITSRLIGPHLTVNDVLLRYPETTSVFDEFRIDACCGGAIPLETVASRHGIDLDALLGALEQSVQRARAPKVAS
jgi:DNA-binding MarR family transcriptional regulator